MDLTRRLMFCGTCTHAGQSMRSHWWFTSLTAINCLVFALLAGAIQSPPTNAQNGGLQAIEVVMHDPLVQSRTEDGFRPVTARVSLPGGTLATKDHDFWIVQRLSTFYSYADGRVEKVLHKKFTLKSGTNSVDVSFSAQCAGQHFQYEEMFLESDGNLTFTEGGARDFCRTTRSRGGLDADFNVLMIQSSGAMSWTLRAPIDFKQGTQTDHDFFLERNGETAAPPNSLLDFDRVLSETLRMYFLPMRGYEFRTQNGENVPDYLSTVDFLNRNQWFSVGTPERLPSDWTGLVNLNLLLISEGDLAALSSEQMNAIRLWLAAGGRLVLTSCEVDRGRLGLLSEKLIGPRETGERRLRDPTWMQLTEQDHSGPLGKSFTEKSVDGLLQLEQAFSPVEYLSFNRCPTRVLDDDAEIGKRDFLFFDLLQGRVVCTAAKVDEFEQGDWRRMLLAAYGNGRSESVRATLGNGTLAGRPLDDFEVTGVGQPPRLLFLGMITLFAIIAGPLAYTILYRNRRVNFLLVIVPAISLLTTLGLVLYVVLADGFQFQTRRLSFSRLDQNAQQAVTLTRHAVFSGTNPHSYSLGANELMLPAWLGGRDRQQVQYLDAGSRITANWIRARMPQQTATAAVVSTTAALDVNRKEANGEITVAVTNRLGGPMVGALLRIENQWYEVGRLGSGETATAKLSSPGDFEVNIRPVFKDARPSPPPLWQSPTEPLQADFKATRLDGLLEHPDQINADLIQDGQYLAVLEDYPGASQLKDYAKYQHQLHLIHGNW